MDILILVPPAKLPSGNLCTAERYGVLLGELGHAVAIGEAPGEGLPEVLIVLHAVKGHEALAGFRAAHPGVPTILVLAGTDIYPAPSETALDSMRLADRLVVLQDRAREKIPAPLRAKVRTIIQSAEPGQAPAPGPPSPWFDICVVGHLRRVKDPMRAAAASRLLPAESRIRIRHAGRILEEEFAGLVKREESENPRYTWLGGLARAEAEALIAGSRLQVLSSIAEGGAQVLGESVVSGTPLLVSRHDAALSLLGDGYPGFFEIGDTVQLAGLMTRAENDPGFLAELERRTRSLAGQFHPQREREAWNDLLSGLRIPQDGTMGSLSRTSD